MTFAAQPRIDQIKAQQLNRATLGSSGHWANPQRIAEIKAEQQAQSAQQPGLWTPNYFSAAATPYAARSTARRAGGGGGSTIAGNYNSYEPSMFQGPGAYWPGHQAEFQAQQQNAMLMINAGLMEHDNRQPAQVAAAMKRGLRSPNPWARVAAGGSYARGGGGSSGGGLADSFQAAMDSANQANEARYGDILGGFQARRQANVGAGGQERKDINTVFDSAASRTRQELIGRGLGNSTILPSMLTGVDRERTDATGRLDERLRREEAALLADQLGFMERRTDAAPDYGLLAQLAQLQGSGGGGGSSGGATPMQISMMPSGGAAMMPVMGGYAPRSNGVGSQTAQQILAVRRRAAANNANRFGTSGHIDNRFGGGAAPNFYTYGLPLATDADLARAY